MKWQNVLMLVFLAVGFSYCSHMKDKQESQRNLAQAAMQLEIQKVERTFTETTGASNSWLRGAGCDDFHSPLYLTQKSIQDTGKAMFNAGQVDVVLVNNKLQLRAEYYSTGECLFAPDISIQAWITDEQVVELNLGEVDRFDRYLLALDVSDTYPKDSGIVVTGKLIGIAERKPKN